ncbi:protein of unknown function [Magnetospirillum sp. XM-1]|nr:protein of unknown function [Magnetospirillum sp. XM-1]
MGHPPLYRILGPAERLRRIKSRRAAGEAVSVEEVDWEIEALLDGADLLHQRPATAKMLDKAADCPNP